MSFATTSFSHRVVWENNLTRTHQPTSRQHKSAYDVILKPGSPLSWRHRAVLALHDRRDVVNALVCPVSVFTSPYGTPYGVIVEFVCLFRFLLSTSLLFFPLFTREWSNTLPELIAAFDRRRSLEVRHGFPSCSGWFQRGIESCKQNYRGVSDTVGSRQGVI